MQVRFEGMKELVDKLNQIAEAPEKSMDKALNEAGKEVKKIEVEVAQRVHDEYSQKVGYKELKKFGVKKRKNGGKQIDIGLKGKISPSKKRKEEVISKAMSKKGIKARVTHWDKIKGLYYNNYGFYHNRTKKYVTGSNWIGTAFDESVEPASKTIKENLIKEMGLDK